MATSGTIGLTTFNNRKVIDNAYRPCKIPSQAVTGEMISIANEQLYLILSSLANTGAPLWCISKELLPLYQGIYTIPMPAGTVDVLNANLRQLQRLTGTETSSEGDAELAFDGDVDTATTEIAPAGYIQTQFDGDTYVTTVGILPGVTGTWDYSLQYSDDGITWVDFQVVDDLAVVDREWIWTDYEGLPAKTYWRLLARNTTVLVVRELVWGNMPQDITLARINKDDYWNQPNKFFQGRPTEYWFDQKVPINNMLLWPAPNEAAQFYQLALLTHRHIMDVGTMVQQLEIPDRWYNAIVWQLAAKLNLITPDAKGDQNRIDKEADAVLKLAWLDQRDNSPIQIMPNISPYTK